jgi:superfamily II DNA or RNA helicase
MAVANREWQTECIEHIASAMASRRDFLVEACPGSGKTRVALQAAAEALRDDVAGIVIVVAPSRHLRRQWCKAARKAGLELTRPANEELADGLPGDVCGYVATYASVANWPQLHQMLCNTRRAFVIFDEVHHAGETRQWGEGLREAFEDAVFRLSLSGTPFRGDNQPIPFVRYNDQGYSEPDYDYGYGRAVGDGVCRPITFPTWRGEAEWYYGGEERRATFDDDLDEQDQSRRLRAALDPKGDLVADMLDHAHRRLTDIRAAAHPDAAGLLVADSQAHARALAELMQRRLGVDPVVAVSDDAEAAQKINAFTDGRAPWLVAVKMVSEGVDIPRLRVGVYATCTVAPLFFSQVVGRFVRMQKNVKEQTAYLYFPADQRLLEQAQQIYRSVKVGLEQKERREQQERDGEGAAENLFVPISARGEEGAHVFDEQVYTAEEIERARQIQQQMPSARALPESMIAAIGRQQALFGGIELAANEDEGESQDRDEQAHKLRKKTQTYVNKIAYRLYGHGNGGQDEVHTKLNKAANIGRNENPTNAKRERKLELAREWLAQTEQRSAANA